jgi:L-iditol 2-dehydrogenase
MRVARLYSPTDIRIEDIPVPKPGNGEALVRVRASGICSGDAMDWYIMKKAPLVLGHEPVGEIVEVDGSVNGFSAGDRVFIHHHAPCMSCVFCNRGDYVQCQTWKSSRIVPGGISEYILVPEINLKNDTLKLPDEVAFEDAVLIEPLACVVKSFRRSGFRKGGTVLVIGLGVMGILHIMLAGYYGAACVIGADRVPYRLQMAERLGAASTVNVEGATLKEYVSSLTGGVGADLVVVGPDSVEAMKEGLECVSPGGTLLLFTPARPGEIFDFDPNWIYFRDISIVPSYSCGPDDTREALSLIRKGIIKAEQVVTHSFSIDEIQTAYELVRKAQDVLKVVILF